MKKIFTLMISAILFSSAFAQYDRGKDMDYGHNRKSDNRNDDRFSSRERDIQIMKINREFDYKIEAIRNKPFMNRFRKANRIAALEDERRDEIKRVYAKFNNRRYGNNGYPKHNW